LVCSGCSGSSLQPLPGKGRTAPALLAAAHPAALELLLASRRLFANALAPTHTHTPPTPPPHFASRVFFSDLATEAIKVEDLDLCCVIPCGVDILYSLSHAYFGSHAQCVGCSQPVQAAGGGGSAERTCSGCGCSRYCSNGCKGAHRPNHLSHCRVVALLGQVVNIDYDRFVDWVAFR
jgi:hypothetical protein